MACLTILLTRVDPQFVAVLTRVDTQFTAVLAPVCATDAGMPILYDAQGNRLYEKDGKYLTYKPE